MSTETMTTTLRADEVRPGDQVEGLDFLCALEDMGRHIAYVDIIHANREFWTVEDVTFTAFPDGDCRVTLTTREHGTWTVPSDARAQMIAKPSA